MKYLIAISVGPVQDFIAAARRTADLTAGSELLVKIAGAAAKSLASRGELIFPATADTPAANKLWAKLDVDDVRAAASAAEEAARGVLRSEWRSVNGQIGARYSVNEALAEAQVEQFLEFYAAWMPLDGSEYSVVRKKVDRLLAARKNLRDFRAAPPGCAPRHVYAKSPLDPAWECVLTAMPEPIRSGEADGDVRRRNPLFLKQTEFLDAVSLIKRQWRQPFYGDDASRDHVLSTRELAQRKVTPKYLARSREEDDEQAPDYAYFAVLIADGDNMGPRIDGMSEAPDHRDFSRKLMTFAQGIDALVAGYNGQCVYAGGDDVLALLPVNCAIGCARDISNCFEKTTGATLSAGIVIVHYRQPLSISLEQARAAEKAAKGVDGKNSLCVDVRARGGQPRHVVMKWSEWQGFEKWIDAFEAKAMVRGIAYELDRLAREFDGARVPAGLVAREAARIWERKMTETGAMLEPLPSHVQDAASLRGFASQLILARFLTMKGAA